MTITAAEQLLIELVNRARLDPLAEAARYGIDLNQGLDSGTLNGSAKQVLAPNTLLHQAAEGHSQWMLDTDTFSHTGLNGSSPHERMVAAGYEFIPAWTSGENLAFAASTARVSETAMIVQNHEQLFRSAGHRENFLSDGYREIGVSQVIGAFTFGQTTYTHSSMLTENFAAQGSALLVTGVVQSDPDRDGFYTPGEGIAGTLFTALDQRAVSAEAGGYALNLPTGATGLVEVSATTATATLRLSLDMAGRNAKLDIVDGTEVRTSASATLHAGITKATLLGVQSLSLIGGAAAETLIANSGNTLIGGGAGNDLIYGGSGHDRLYGGLGNDTVFGGAGNDQLFGSAGRNQLFGGDGADFIQASTGGDFIGGGAGNDTIRGSAGADTIYGGAGNDNLAGGAGNDQIFGSAGNNIIYAGLGNDTVQGGSGNDTIYGSAGRNQLFGNNGNDVIYTSAAGDFAAGGAGNDSIFGSDGADTIYAGLGDDFIGGGAGNDLIFGGAGDNRIFGGLGNDRVVAGTGKDVMTGGPGADVFVFTSAAHIGIGAGRDVITDFQSGVDDIDLRALATTFNGTDGLLGDGQASFFYHAPGGLLIGDQNGDGVADWVLELTGVSSVTAGDFLL
ncbi:MAG: CAP domain-containing protein [Paracoccaceae bacterium]